MATAMNNDKCKGCGKPVKFLKDKLGKWQILDERAPVFEVKRDFLGDKYADKITEGFYVSHFSTCTKPNDFSANNNRGEKHE